MNIIFKFLIVTFFLAGCTGSIANIDSSKKESAVVENTGQYFNLQDGLYYAYKTCLRKNIMQNGLCKKGKAVEWSPLKTKQNQYLTSIDSRGVPDDFYLLKDGNKVSFYYTQRLVEAWVIGWGELALKINGNNLIATSSKYFQTNGIPQIGSDSDDAIEKLGFNTLNSSEIVGVQKKGLELPFKFALPFILVNNDELSLDCIQHEKINKTENDFSPISELCSLDPLVSKIWLKKIANVNEINANTTQKDALSESKNISKTKFERVDFGGYRNINSSNSCSWEYSPMEYCDKKHIALYERALLNEKVNFNQHYIVLPILEFPEYNQYSLVIIDQNTGTVYPLPFDWYEGKKGVKEPVQFSLDSNQVCINGDIHHWRIDEEGKACFQFDGEKFIGHKTNYMN